MVAFKQRTIVWTTMAERVSEEKPLEVHTRGGLEGLNGRWMSSYSMHLSVLIFFFFCSISSSEPPGIICEYHPLPHFRKQCFKLYHSNHLLLFFKIINVFLILGILSGMKLGRHLLNAIWISDIMLPLEKRKCFIVPALVALCYLI